MKRLQSILTVLAVVALSASLTYWGQHFYKGPVRTQLAGAVASVPDAPLEAAASLFGGQPASVAVSNYQLKGVVAAINGRDSVAIIAIDGKPALALKVGRELAPGITVKQVQPRFVLLLEGGVSKRLELAADAKGASGGIAPAGMPASPVAPPPVYVAPPQAPPGVRANGVTPTGVPPPPGAQQVTE